MSELTLKGKRLLILGGAAQCLKVVKAAQGLGVYTIVADLSANKKTAEAADEYLQCSLLDYERLIQWCEDNPVDGVLNFCVDFGQHAHQKLCERFGFPSFGPESLYNALTDKDTFKKQLTENGLGIIPTYDTDNPGSVEYPVLVKPSESSGSRGSSVCFNKEQLEAGISKALEVSRNGHYLLEKYMAGYQDFAMTYVFVDGKPNLVRTGDRYLGQLEDGLERQCICSVSPSRNSEMYVNNVHPKIVKMLRKLGLRNGPVFMQGFVDGDTVRFYDPGLRFPGTDYENLLLKATGFNLMENLVKYALGKPLDDCGGRLNESYKLNGNCSIQLMIDSRPGLIASVEGFEEIRRLPYVVTVSQKAFEGDIIPPSKDIKQRIAEIVILVEDKPTVIRNAIKTVQSLLKVKDADGNNMLISQINPDSIKL